jgi:hypothetical protein
MSTILTINDNIMAESSAVFFTKQPKSNFNPRSKTDLNLTIAQNPLDPDPTIKATITV